VILYLDPFMGIAGDMTVAALVDAGADPEAVNRAVGGLGVRGLSFRFERVRRQGLGATLATASLPEYPTHRHLGDILSLIGGSSLPEAPKEKVRATFRALAEAEAKVHGCAVEEVHFHEVGAADAIADVVGACAAWDALGRPEVRCGRINVGSGFTVMEHGTFPVPPPAVAELLRERPVFSFGEPIERTTPTGAALAIALSSSFGALPPGRIRAVGYGAGTKETAGAPNVLRALLIAEDSQEGVVSVIEAQVDDVTPELLAGALDSIRGEGALDVFVTPVAAKKGRPGWTVTVLCPLGDTDRISGLLLERTTTTGVRFSRWERRELHREVRSVETPAGTLRVKAVTLPSGRVRLHPEWEDVKKLAEEAGIPVLEMAEKLARWLP
jgi:pyridinium-3,5-bisthiocarboxylic acid mononucleotide nickel chelatase